MHMAYNRKVTKEYTVRIRLSPILYLGQPFPCPGHQC